MAIMTEVQAETMGRNAQAAGFSRNKALRAAPIDEDLQAVFMDAYDGASQESPKAAPDDAITDALMSLLETKLAAFMNRADLSDSPPADKVAIRAGYFLGVSAGLSLGNAITGADGEAAAAALDTSIMTQEQAE